MPSYSLRKLNAAAGTRYTRWSQVEGQLNAWHPQIHRRFAEKDGRVPSDFTWMQYPISNVRFSLPFQGEQHRTLIYEAEISPDTPQTNQYFKADERDPGKTYKEVLFGSETWYELVVTGTALSRVKFSLIDLADHEVLHESATGHIDGAVEAGMGQGPAARDALLWKRLTPGTTLRVRLEAIPLFFPYCDPETGSGGTEYAMQNNGYHGGDVVVSPEYTLAMTEHGLPEPPHLLLDGQPALEKPEFQLRGQEEGETFSAWLTREREALTAKDEWLTADRIAGQVGIDEGRYAEIESGTAEPQYWERSNIEDVIKGWQEYYA